MDVMKELPLWISGGTVRAKHARKEWQARVTMSNMMSSISAGCKTRRPLSVSWTFSSMISISRHEIWTSENHRTR